MKELLKELIAYANRAVGNVANRTIGDRMRKIARAHGPTNPVGDGDAKTGAPGTYRPVGDTCPLSCTHHPENDGTCYALFHNVNRIRTARLLTLKQLYGLLVLLLFGLSPPIESHACRYRGTWVAR